MDEIKELIPRIGIRYLWKLSELVLILFVVSTTSMVQFGEAVLSLVLIYFMFSLIKLPQPPGDGAFQKKFYNTLSLAAPAIGIFVSLFLLLINFFRANNTVTLAAIIVLLKSLSLTPEVFYQSRDAYERLYKRQFISMFSTLLFAVLLVLTGIKANVLMVSYTFFHFVLLVLMWWEFPVKIKPAVNRKMLEEIRSSFTTNFLDFIMPALASYLPLMLAAAFLDLQSFAVFYIAYYLSLFFYENLTLFLNSQFLGNFIGYDDENFKNNLVRILEYNAFLVVPLSVMFILITPEFFKMVLPDFHIIIDIVILLLFAGMIKSIFGILRLVFLRYDKIQLIQRLSAMESIALMVIYLLLRHFEIVGLAIAVLISSIVSAFLFIIFAKKYTKMDFFGVSRDYFYIVFSSVLAALLTGLFKEYFVPKTIYGIFFHFLFGLVAYGILTFLFNKDLYRRFIRFMFEEY